MTDFEVVVTPAKCPHCAKHCDLKNFIDRNHATSGALKRVGQAQERANITKALNRNDLEFQAGKRSQYDFDLIIAKSNHRLDVLDHEVAKMESSISFTCDGKEAGGVHVDADVSVRNLVVPTPPYTPTFETYANALKLLTTEVKAKLRVRNELEPLHLEKFLTPMPNIEVATLRYIEEVRAANIDSFLFNELEQTLKLFIDEPPRKWREELQTVINAITRLAKEDARSNMPTEDEKLLAEADRKLGPLVENPGGE